MYISINPVIKPIKNRNPNIFLNMKNIPSVISENTMKKIIITVPSFPARFSESILNILYVNGSAKSPRINENTFFIIDI